MTKLLIVFSLLFINSLSIEAQNIKLEKIYDPTIDVSAQVNAAIQEAKSDNKHVLIQIGGNWCSWCLRFHKFVNEDDSIKSILDKEYVYILLNIDKEHPQKEMMQELSFPNRFGFPVFVILDQKGFQLHTQNSVYLESGKSYNAKTVKSFLNDWTVKAVDPESYK